MTNPKLREVYEEYRLGNIPWEQVVSAADKVIERYEQSRSSQRHPDDRGGSSQPRGE